MKTPDKIYIQPNAHDGWFEGNKPNDNFVDYLSKDALLEWAKNMKRICKGAEPIEKAYQTIIDRIESL